MGDSVVSMTRRRYRLTGNPDFQLLHYTSISSESQKVPIVPSKIRCWPRDPAVLQKMARGEMSAASVSNAKKKLKTKLNSQIRVQENFSKENLGDELDGSINRAVATERYKRNHVFIDLIFSPFSAEVMKSTTNNNIDQKENIKEDIAQLESEILELESKFKMDKSELFSGKSLHHDLDEISRITEVDEINGFVEKWGDSWNRKLGWRTALVTERKVKTSS